LTPTDGGPSRRRLLERPGVFVAALTLLITVGLAAEFHSYARPDTGFLLDAAARVLAGARLYVDVVEINPPLIVALNMPAVLLGRLLGVSGLVVYRLGFALVLLGGLALDARLLRRVAPDDIVLRRALLLLFAFALFPLAGQDFGEREHLVLALALPYLILAAARGLGLAVARAEALGLGFLGGLAFALKPQFLPMWLGVEGYLRLTGRVSRKALLPETVGIAAFLAAYGVSVLVFAPQYLALVRLLAGPYGRFLYDPFLHLLVMGPGALLTLFALLTMVALYRYARHPELWRALALGTVACLFAGAVQQKGLRYHFYPSFALAAVTLGAVGLDVRNPLGSWVPRVYRILAVSVLGTMIAIVAWQNAASALRLGPDAERVRFEKLVGLVRDRAAGGSVYVMSYHIGSAYPLINYSGTRSASRFPQLWILAAEYLDALKSSRPLRYHDPAEMSPSERFLNRAVREDLQTNQPALLLILRHARDLPANGYRRLNYVAYFGRDSTVARILAGYQLVGDVGDYAVYERVPDGAARSGPAPSSEPGTHDVLRPAMGDARLQVRDPTTVAAVLTFLIILSTVLVGDVRRAKSAG